MEKRQLNMLYYIVQNMKIKDSYCTQNGKKRESKACLLAGKSLNLINMKDDVLR